MATLTELFNEARLLAGKRKSCSHFYDGLEVAGTKYYGTLLTKKGGEHRQGRDKWTAAIYMLRGSGGVAASFHGYGATAEEAIDDMELFALAWADQQPAAAAVNPLGQDEASA